jgi:hypothetical protein
LQKKRLVRFSPGIGEMALIIASCAITLMAYPEKSTNRKVMMEWDGLIVRAA